MSETSLKGKLYNFLTDYGLASIGNLAGIHEY